MIHRDIKGANILTNKEGVVKLADFGVATKLVEGEKHNTVVGTPYWMAPEIIEMTGVSTASDIWSVGCTIVELITGKPPYFDLEPMPALFRIVQDDHPPLPKGISAAGANFLMQCFQKDPNLRVGAAALLRHPWITKHLAGQPSATAVDVEEARRTIRLYNMPRARSSAAPDALDAIDDDEPYGALARASPTQAHPQADGRAGRGNARGDSFSNVFPTQELDIVSLRSISMQEAGGSHQANGLSVTDVSGGTSGGAGVPSMSASLQPRQTHSWSSGGSLPGPGGRSAGNTRSSAGKAVQGGARPVKPVELVGIDEDDEDWSNGACVLARRSRTHAHARTRAHAASSHRTCRVRRVRQRCRAWWCSYCARWCSGCCRWICRSSSWPRAGWYSSGRRGRPRGREGAPVDRGCRCAISRDGGRREL